MMQKEFSDEIKLILACAKPELDPEIHSLIKHSLDWKFIFKQAAYHRIMHLIYCGLNKIDDKEGLLPLNVFSRLKEYYNMSLAKNLLFSKELHFILNALDDAGIDAIPIKGIVLAEILYSNIALREIKDVDILIKAEDVSATEKALSQAGYHMHLEGYPEEYYRQYHCHMPYLRSDEHGRGFRCEVHWALSFPRPNVISLPNIWKNRRIETINNMEMSCLSYEDIFFSLVLHLRRYYVPLSLKYICDISRLVELYKDKINWDYIITESRNNRIVSTSYYALYFAKEMLDAPAPENVLSRLDPGLIRRKYLHSLIKNKTFSMALRDAKTRQYTYVFLRLLLYDRLTDFLSYIIFIPIEEFARFYGLPLNSKKTKALYHIRILYILFRSLKK